MHFPTPLSFSRRSLLLGAGSASAAVRASYQSSARIVGARFGKPVRFNRPGHSVIGDTWSCAWSDDDELYTVIDDTAGFDMSLRPSKDRNVAIGSFGRSSPPTLEGRMVNGMETCGRSNQLGVDGACWKGNGIASVDGALYLSVSRHWYHRKEYDFRQIARDASILKSADKGKTWNPLPYNAQPLSDPLFPGPRFATPFFLDTGRDSRAPEGSPHGLGEYVYSVSNDGYWNNGNALHLARVRRADLPKLDLKNWEFYCGHRDDPAVPVWRAGKPGLEACYPILSGPFRFGQTGMNYIAPLRRFLLVSWHYPKLAEGSWNHQTSVWDLWEAPSPWGPWNRFATQVWNSEGFYNPSLPSKFISADGKSLWALTAGDFNTWDKSLDQTLYTLYTIPLTLETVTG